MTEPPAGGNAQTLPKGDSNPSRRDFLAGAATPQSHPDPVADMGRRIVAIVAAIERNENAQLRAGAPEDIRLEQEEHHLKDLLSATAEMATEVRAATAVGAMLQIMLARDDAECILSWVQDDHYGDCTEMYRRVERCLYSVLGVLAEASGIDPATVGGDYYMSPKYDPLAMRSSALAVPGASPNLDAAE